MISGPVVLCVLDGWGESHSPDHNAIALAQTPTWDHLVKTWPTAPIDASAGAVGLPDGQMGNSEVGHMTLGSGRIILQDLPRINQAIQSETLSTTPAFHDLVQRLQQTGKPCHVMGLLSPGGVHSHEDHIFALLKALAAANTPTHLHAFLDGRDTPPKSAHTYIDAFMKRCETLSGFTLASLSGRYYAMDRDQRWERTEKAYRALVHADAPTFTNPLNAITQSYKADRTDEFMFPMVREGYKGMEEGSGLLCANFRSDRVRQILGALVDPNFDAFDRPRLPKFATQAGMASYSKVLDPHLSCLFPPQIITQSLGELVSKAGKKQLRIAETEKYAHVTFFLNGGREDPFKGEDRILIPSPKVATYDLQPEMAAADVTDRLIQALDKETYGLVVVNYANPDMVGHTGNLDATIQAIETVDACLQKLEAAVLKHGGALLITADHGNAEVMLNMQTGTPHTAHTCNPVPFVLMAEACRNMTLNPGGLSDIMPTILKLMNLKIPPEISGKSLL